jgi:hypothetical protein
MQVQRIRLFILVILSLIVFNGSALAQIEKSTTAPAVTASASAGNVRFTAPGQVLQIRLEIYNAAGDITFDSSLRKGNIIDWKVTDATQVMTDGSYLCVVTVMDFEGNLRQRIGALSLQAGEVALKPATKEELTAAQMKSLDTRRQAQKIEGADNSDALTILREGRDRSVVVTTVRMVKSPQPQARSAYAPATFSPAKIVSRCASLRTVASASAPKTPGLRSMWRARFSPRAFGLQTGRFLLPPQGQNRRAAPSRLLIRP